jgi:hypothetical protein
MATTTPTATPTGRPANPGDGPDPAQAVAQVVAKLGGGVRPEEIAYQLRRRGLQLTAIELVDALCQAEARGLITPYAWTVGIETQP